MTDCPCGKPAGDDAYLCRDCQTSIDTTLTSLPVLVLDLELTMAKQRRFGPMLTRSTDTDDVLPFNLAAAALLRELHREATKLVARYRLTHPGPAPAGHTAAMAAWMHPRVPDMVGLPWAPTLLVLPKLATRAERVIDAPADRVYAGPCGDCGTDLYAPATSGYVKCRECGTSYDLATRRAWLLDLVDDRLATGVEIARALTSLELPVTAERIRQWKHRDRLTVRASDAVGRPLYRVGDVVDLLLAYADKRGA